VTVIPHLEPLPALSGELIKERLSGSTGLPSRLPTTPAIDLMLRHRSVRGFRPDALPEGALASILMSATSAATSSNLQTWSVVEVRDSKAKAACAAMAGGQKHIEDAPCFLLFVADLARLSMMAEDVGSTSSGNDTLEMFLVATIDASLAAQNAVIAAESLGLSTVYIGGMRNKPEEVASLIGLPPGAAVVFGLCIGYARPDAEGMIKPRLPLSAVWHQDRYDLQGQKPDIASENTAMDRFYKAQNMQVRGSWADHSARRIANADSLSGRHLLMSALRRMGFFKAE
jgi:nitroreductase